MSKMTHLWQVYVRAPWAALSLQPANSRGKYGSHLKQIPDDAVIGRGAKV